MFASSIKPTSHAHHRRNHPPWRFFNVQLTPANAAVLRLLDLKYRLYNFIRHPKKPRSLRSGDFSIWRDDYRRVNGFDENFCGWGGEDDDLGRRLRRAGVRLQSFLRWTHSYHLWHPTETSRPDVPRRSHNAQYLSRKGRLIRCRNGLIKRTWNDLAWRIVGSAARPQEVNRWLAGRILPITANENAADRASRRPMRLPSQKWNSCSCPAKEPSAAPPNATCWWR